jgi:hypothetical protein
MVGTWLCMVDDNGLPIFERSYGIPPPGFSFSNAVLLFNIRQSCINGQFEMQQLASKDSHIVMKDFKCQCSSVIMILVTGDISMSVSALQEKLQLIWDAMIMVMGLKVLNSRAQILRNSMRTVSALLDSLINLNSFQAAIGVPEIALSGSKKLVAHVNQLAQHLETGTIALYHSGILVAGSSSWNELHSRDLFLLSSLIRCAPEVRCRDIAIYLPTSELGEESSPGLTLYRLVSVRLVGELEILALNPSRNLTESILALRSGKYIHHKPFFIIISRL